MQQLKNIESAFKHIRLFSIVVIIAVVCICCYCLFLSYQRVNEAQERVYIIAGGKAIEAFASNRKDNIPVEARDHIRMFHEHFFTLSPDEKAIESNIKRALYLADRSAKDQYDDLKEKDYFSSIIRGNVSQEVSCDSVSLQINNYPYYFRYYGRQQIIRSSVIITRSLITEGYLRTIERTDNNAHGFLIERWVTLENKDLQIQKR